MPKPVRAIAAFAPKVITYTQVAAAATAPDCFIFVNPSNSGEYYEIAEVAYNYDVAGGASAAADLKVCASGTAAASGTSALTAAADLTAAARTPRTATISTTLATRTVKPGDSLSIDTSGTLTGLAGLVVQVTLIPVRGKKRYS